MIKNVRRIYSYWTDILVTLEPNITSHETMVRVVWKLRDSAVEWPYYGQVINVEVSNHEPLIPL